VSDARVSLIMSGMGHATGAAPDDDDVVPIFGTWRGIYAAVIATAIVVLILLALFSGWPF